MKTQIMIHTTARLLWKNKEEMHYFLLNYWGVYRQYLYLFDVDMDIKEILTVFWSKTITKYRNIFWRNPGYCAGVDQYGDIIQLTNFDAITNGAKGHNAQSIHIFWDGGIELENGKFKVLDNRNEMQKAGLLNLILNIFEWNNNLEKKHDLVQIIGHNDVDKNKSCPLFDPKEEYTWIMA